jgi:predicted nuclease of predicted toxin-antitoxin system
VKKRKLLVDSCVARAVTERLRAGGHDVVALAERGFDPGDPAILAIAVSEGRALVTIDTDFGVLVFRDGVSGAGVLRLRHARGDAQATRAVELVAAHGDDLETGAFVTDDGDGVRVRKRS